MFRAHTTLFVLLLGSSALAEPPSAELESGLPYFRFYPAKEAGGGVGAGASSWAAAQDPQGVLYFGNESGVLEYDGASWRLTHLPNLSVVRSLAVDAEGEIWVGGQGEIGRLERAPTGRRRFVSLLGRLPAAQRSFGDVWGVLATGPHVYFSSTEQLMRLHPGSGAIDVWPSPAGPLRYVFAAHGRVYVALRAGGLLEVGDRGLAPFAANASLPAEFVRCVLPLPGGTLGLWSRAGTYVSDGQTARRVEAPVAAELQARQIYACAPQPDGTVAVATQAGGVLLSDVRGRSPWVADRAAGLPENLVTFVHVDRQGGVWAGLSRGLVRIERPGARSAFDGRNGIDGSVLGLARHEGTLYAGTYSGLARLVPAQGARSARFESVPGSDQTFALLPTEAGLLTAGRLGVSLLRDGHLSVLHAAQGGFDLLRSRRDPTLAVAGEPGAVVMLRRRGHAWQVERALQVKGFVRRLLEEDDGRIWAGTENTLVARLDPRQDPPALETFDQRASLVTGYASPFALLGKTVFLTAQQTLVWDETERRFVPDATLATLLGGQGTGLTLLAAPRPDELWIGGESNAHLVRGADGSWNAAPLAPRLTGDANIRAVHLDADGTAWLGSTQEVERHASGIIPAETQEAALVRGVLDLMSGETLLDGTPGPSLVLPYGRRSLRFAFAAPSFDDERRTRYRTTLEGFDAEASPWSDETHRDYTNLPEGRYTLRVEARDAGGRDLRPALLPLRVLAPWYRAPWAYGLWTVAAAALVLGASHWRSARLRERNRQLQALVDERTREIQAKSEALQAANRELSMANDQLAHLNAEKNEFLGIVAHDLKNPLGAVRGYAEMLQEDAGELPPQEVGAFAAKIEKATRLMFDLVTNLLDINRIEQGQMKVELQPLDLAAAARHAAATYAERAAAKGQALEVEVEPGVPLAVADPSPLAQVVDNLVSNAVKYSPPNRPITLRVRRADGRLRLEVQDRGPGLSPDDLSKLFGKFARLSARPTGGEHSTGLGLAIVKRMVESMGGRVWCESVLGEGATFVLELPVAL